MASRAVLGAPGGDCTRLSGVRGDPAAPREDPTRDAAAGGSGKPGPGVGSRQLALGFPSCISSLSILPRGRRGCVVRSRRGSVTCSAPCCGSGPLRPHCPFRRAGAVTPSSGCCRGSGRAPLGRPGRGTELGSLCPLHALHRGRCVALGSSTICTTSHPAWDFRGVSVASQLQDVHVQEHSAGHPGASARPAGCGRKGWRGVCRPRRGGHLLRGTVLLWGAGTRERRPAVVVRVVWLEEAICHVQQETVQEAESPWSVSSPRRAGRIPSPPPTSAAGGTASRRGAGAAGAPRVHACGLVGHPLRGECVLCAGRWVRAPGPWAAHGLAAADREGPPRVGDSHLSGLSHFLVTVSLPDSPRPPCRFSRPAAHCPRAARVRLALAGAAAGAFLTRPPNLELGPSPAHLGG